MPFSLLVRASVDAASGSVASKLDRCTFEVGFLNEDTVKDNVNSLCFSCTEYYFITCNLKLNFRFRDHRYVVDEGPRSQHKEHGGMLVVRKVAMNRRRRVLFAVKRDTAEGKSRSFVGRRVYDLQVGVSGINDDGRRDLQVPYHEKRIIFYR